MRDVAFQKTDWFMCQLLPLSQVRIPSSVPDLKRRCPPHLFMFMHTKVNWYECFLIISVAVAWTLKHRCNETRVHRLRYCRNWCGLRRVTFCHDCTEFLHWLNIISIRGVRRSWFRRWVDAIVLKEILGIDSPLTLLYAKVYKPEE